MSGFERFTVLEPINSKEVRSRLQIALDTRTALPMTLSPESEAGVTPLRSEPTHEEFILRDANFRDDEITYLGYNRHGDTITIIVKRSDEESSIPAVASIVRRTRVHP